ncbi:2,3-dihydro-2,3-dihydroxybenzoate dehydrogenase [Actinophytocola sp.]|uniref:2,3-dihydro-2,3-dihydroxybenzoate dehydrogenase n=1 Tax=Actinophytocola sp. TaxID=1872138 RepID=UPI002ED2AB13
MTDSDHSGIMGRVAIVTGAGGGIGAAVALALAARGASVIGVDHDEISLRATVTEITDKGHSALAYPLDVRDSAAVDHAVDTVERDVGPVGILANVAGVLRLGAVVDLTDDDWSSVFAVNTQGVFYLSRAVARRMVVRGRGVIVSVSSNAGGVPRMHMAAYAASKAATTAFTKCLGLELAAHGIRCNVVSPGSTDTAMLRGMWADADGARAAVTGSPELFKVGIPLGKLGMPADVAEAVVFLASDRAGHITMHDLYVDGGAALGG